MKIIEIYDKDHPVFNIMSQVIYPDAQIVFLGVTSELGNKYQKRLKAFFRKRKAAEPEFLVTKTPTIDSFKELLLSCVDEDTWFEVRGGNDIALVAMGIVAAEKHVSMFQINHNKNEVNPVSGELPNVECKTPDLKFDELICLTGGCIKGSADKGFLPSSEVKEAIEKLWSKEKNDLARFNNRSSRFVELVNSYIDSSNPLAIAIPAEEVQNLGESRKGETLRQINVLKECGFIDDSGDGERIRFRYKNKVFKDIMDKSGSLLELHSKLAAEETGVFSDVRQGVKLDWDGKVTEIINKSGTYNEIDLILVKGFSVTYVSCKSGKVDNNALYELDTVVGKFDIGNTKRMLICNKIYNPALEERARDMNVRVIKDVGSFSRREEFGEMIAGL